jgi:hypothetical protein
MDNSLPLWIQDALLLASAVLVWLYVRATNKLVEIGQHQIEKTNLLAEAAQRQTAAVEGQLAILRAQLEDEEREGIGCPQENALRTETCGNALGRTNVRHGCTASTGRGV